MEKKRQKRVYNNFKNKKVCEFCTGDNVCRSCRQCKKKRHPPYETPRKPLPPDSLGDFWGKLGDNRILRLNLKQEPFWLTVMGEKTIEYRKSEGKQLLQIKDHWHSRIRGKKFQWVVLTLGYPKACEASFIVCECIR